MSMETAADRAAFFDVSENADASAWRTGGVGDPATVPVILRRDPVQSGFAAVGVAAVAWSGLVLSADVPAGVPARGDVFVVAAGTFRVAKAEPDVLGAVYTLTLEGPL